MKTLYLLRHAKSHWPDSILNDHDRPLAPRGEQAAQAMKQQLCHYLSRLDLVLCSTALRAIQTLNALILPLHGVSVYYEKSLYTFSASDLLARLRALAEIYQTVLIIGHNPALQTLALTLLPQSDQSPQARLLRKKYPTGGFAAFTLKGRWADLCLSPPPVASLQAFMRPPTSDQT